MQEHLEPEYCLLWVDHWAMCMTKGEWSGWVEAIGTILAVVGAFAIASYQASRTHRDYTRSLTQLVVNAATLVQHICSEVSSREALVDAAESDRHSLLFAELAAIRTSLRTIPLHQLPGRAVSHVMEAAWAVEQFHTLIERALKVHRKMNAANYAELFESLDNLSTSVMETARRLAKDANATIPERKDEVNEENVTA